MTQPTDRPAEQCCVCGSPDVTYHNYREQPFCWPCADCQCNATPCVRETLYKPAQPTDRPGINQLHNLADRAERHQLTPDEAARLRDGIAKLDIRINGYRDSRKRWMDSAFADRRVSNELASRLAEAEQRAVRAEAAIERVRKALAERRAEIVDYEAENEPAAWSDAAVNTCSRIEDALRHFPEPQGIRIVLDQHGQTPA